MAKHTIKSLLFVLVLQVAAPAVAGSIRGTVAPLPGRPDAPARYVTRTAAKPAHAENNAISQVAVIVERTDSASEGAPPDADTVPQVMAQEGTRFVPNLLIVPVGGVVSFPNHDPIFHNVFSYSPAKTFDLGRYPKGETRTVTFTQPGVIRVFCEIHSSMYASIVVTNSPWHRLISTGEEFVFDDLPPGDYRILAADAAGRHTVMELTLQPDETRSIALALEK
ncbi:MAG: hypothetical protein Kow0074_21210 [Candidatus Zixiibacteriota bacterium]